MTTNTNENLGQSIDRPVRRSNDLNDRISESSIVSESLGDTNYGRFDVPVPEIDSDYSNETRGEAVRGGDSLREVNIKPLDSGYLVKVGCQSVAVETTETLLKTLGDYLNNPFSFESAWFKNENRSKV